MGIEFYQTRMGVTFFEGTLPKLIEAVTKLTSAVDKAANLLKFEEDGAVKVSTVPAVIFVIRYSHRHGNDVWAKRTEAEALGSIADAMEHWIEDQFDQHPDVRRDLRAAMKDNNIQGAMRIWENNSDEFFEITRTNLDEAREDSSKG